MFFGYQRDGIAADTFLHLVDAWVEGEMGTMAPRKIDEAVDTLDPFLAAQGDRFADADDLERAIDEWKLRAGKRQFSAAKRILTDLLEMWRMLEE